MNGKDRVWNLKSIKKAFSEWRRKVQHGGLNWYVYELPEELVPLSPVHWITALCIFNISSLFKCSIELQQRTRNSILVWNLSQVHIHNEICLIKGLLTIKYSSLGRFNFLILIHCTAIARHKDTPWLYCAHLSSSTPHKKTDVWLCSIPIFIASCHGASCTVGWVV